MLRQDCRLLFRNHETLLNVYTLRLLVLSDAVSTISMPSLYSPRYNGFYYRKIGFNRHFSECFLLTLPHNILGFTVYTFSMIIIFFFGQHSDLLIFNLIFSFLKGCPPLKRGILLLESFIFPIFLSYYQEVFQL